MISTLTSAETGQQLLRSIDDDAAKLKTQKWKANLPFSVAYECYPSDPFPSSFSSHECNLFDLTSNLKSNMIARFDPNKFPVVPGGWKANETSWQKLSTDLIAASKKDGGCPVTSNGKYGKNRVIVCSRHRHYESKSSRKKADGAFRSHSMNNDKLNSRPNGKSLKRKTGTMRPFKQNEDITCKVKLVIGVDDHSFFVVCGTGNDMHEGHPPMATNEMTTRKRIVPEKAKELATRMRLNGARPGVIADVLKDLHGVELTKRQVHSGTGMAKFAKDLIGVENLEKYKDCDSDTDRVIKYLKSEGCSCVALTHQKGDPNLERKLPKGPAAAETGPTEDILIAETMDADGEVQSSIIGETGTNQMNENVMKYANDTRKVVGAKDDQDVLVALVWVTERGKQYMQAFPEQVSMDGTHKTTAQEWELLTLTVQDMNGGQETVLRCWAPNNREWFFRWFLQSAVPMLVGRRTCQGVRLLICDGDKQECAQIDAALVFVFPNAMRRRCGWHLSDRAWDREFGKQIGPASHPNRVKIDKLEVEIKAWLYSLMKEIETVEEYKV